jgi:hypothetical protein
MAATAKVMAVVVADERGQMLQSATVHCGPRDAPLRRPGSVRSEFWRRSRMNIVGSRDRSAPGCAVCVFCAVLPSRNAEMRAGGLAMAGVFEPKPCGGADSTLPKIHRTQRKERCAALSYQEGRPNVGVVTPLPMRSCEVEVLRAQRVSINVAVPTDKLRPLSTLAARRPYQAVAWVGDFHRKDHPPR